MHIQSRPSFPLSSYPQFILSFTNFAICFDLFIKKELEIWGRMYASDNDMILLD
jgi:hypothetical protein